MENQLLVSPSQQYCSTSVGFNEIYLSKEQCNNTEALADFYLFTRLETVSKRLRFSGVTDIIKNATEELKRLSQNFVSCNFTVTGRRVYFNKGTTSRETQLK